MARPKADPEAVALYRAILSHPDEDTPRLVFADWLDEHGDHARAEFIRVQCRLARTSEWDDGYTADRLRAERLHREHWEEWVRPPTGGSRLPYPRSCEPVRGFPGVVYLGSGMTPSDARRWYATQPITRVEVDPPRASKRDSWNWRLTSDALPHLRTIRLELQHRSTSEVALAACQALASAECRSALTRLEIAGDPTLEGLEAVITSPHLRKLEALSVRGDGVGDDHARLLADKLNLPALRELELGHGLALTDVGTQALAGADWFARLHTLRLFGYSLGDWGLRKLLGARPLPELRTLQVHDCGQNGGEMRLAGGRTLPGLVELITTGGNYPWGKEFLALARGRQRFLSLTLRGVLGELDAAKFFNKPALRDLRRLVWGQRLKADEVAALVASPARSLRWLELSSEQDPGPALVAGPGWPHLERLVISNGMSGQSLAALVESEKFPRLVSLKAWCYDGRAMFLKRLARSPAAAKFRELEVRAEMTPAVARELADSPHLGDIDRLVVNKGTAGPKDCERLLEGFGKRIEIKDSRD